MPSLDAIYRPENLYAAYQLNWSLTTFTRTALPCSAQWLEKLRFTTENDGVRILEYRERSSSIQQFFVSTKPHVAPSAIIKSVKGRLQHALRDEMPRLFKRNYRLESVGETNNETLQNYVGRQAQRHAMADDRIQARMESLQYYDSTVDLSALQYSAHGQYIVNFHLVFENRERLSEVREDALRRTRDMIIRASQKKSYRLARIGLASNHVHLLLGCGLEHDALSVATGFMNNIGYAHGMTPVLEYGFYAGTFGNYDRDAIRRWLCPPR
jgi:REP element-mobilizing transposase RayT